MAITKQRQHALTWALPVLCHRTTAVVEWLLSRPDSQRPGADRALIVPSIRSLHLGRSKLGCHAALSKAGLPTLRTVAVLSAASAAATAETLCAANGSCFIAREDCGGRQLTPEVGDGVLRGSAELLQALGAADPPPCFPVVLQECPDYLVYSRVQLLYVDHKLESIVGLVGGAAGEEAFRAQARPFLTELAGFLDRNDVALAQVEVALATDAAAQSPHCKMWVAVAGPTLCRLALKKSYSAVYVLALLSLSSVLLALSLAVL